MATVCFPEPDTVLGTYTVLSGEVINQLFFIINDCPRGFLEVKHLPSGKSFTMTVCRLVSSMFTLSLSFIGQIYI